ncbi:MAG: oligosaccharide flippase family protein, partial [Chloroflexota bacterium]|nr:oligosaccharide flippase family protein [Chloroflexota bacterium]
IWVLANALGGYGALLDLGISTTIQKYVSEHRARGSARPLSAIVSTGFVLYIVVAGLALAALGGLASFVPRLFDVGSDLRHAAFWVTLLIAVQIAIALPGATLTAVLRGLQRFDLANILVIAGTLLSAALVLVALRLGTGVVGVAAASAIVTAVMQLPAIWLVRRAAPDVRLDLHAVTRESVRSVFSFSASVFLVRLAVVVKARTDAIVIGAALPVRMITPYALAQRLAESVSLLVGPFVQVLLPIASDASARDDRDTVRAVYLTASRIALALSIGLALTVAILASAILEVWVGAAYAPYGYLVAILAAVVVIDTLGWTAGSVLTGLGLHRPLAWMATGNAAVKVVLSIILVHPFGLPGVAVAAIVPSAVEAAFFVMPYSLRALGVRASEFAAQVVFPNVLPTAVMLAALVVAATLTDTDSAAALAATLPLAFLAYFVAYARFSATDLERRFYRALGGGAWSLLTRPGRN